MKRAHIHADLITEYAKDATKTDKPWELWEVKRSTNQTGWKRMDRYDNMYLGEGDYRRRIKPKPVKKWIWVMSDDDGTPLWLSREHCTEYEANEIGRPIQKIELTMIEVEI